MMCSEASPRVSFSHDSGQEDGVPPRDDATLVLDMNSDFEFNIASSSEQESCSAADELFANGVILPIQFQKTTSSRQVQRCAAPPPTVSLLPPLPPPPPPPHENSKKYFQKTEEVNKDSDEEIKPSSSSQSKSFWGFKRSSSLNHDVKKSAIRSLTLLSRSNSTGSAHKDPQNKPSSSRSQKLQASPSTAPHPYQLQLQQQQKNKKNYVNGGVKVSPVLNLPPPYISKGTANLFGFGSLLRSSNGSKDKKNKK